MTARILDGKAVLATIKDELKGRVAALAEQGVVPGLGTVLVGDDPGSHWYVNAKHRELSGVLDAVYGVLVGAAESEGADLLKWGGDAVLMLFEGRDHPLRAVRAALGMQRVLGRAGPLRT